jgi:hypothetical protein
LTETVGITIKANIDLDKAKLDFQSTLQIMQRSGLIARTAKGKIYLTKRGKNQQQCGFSIIGPILK